MESITFLALKNESLYDHMERRYVREDRWTEVLPSEATHFRWTAPSTVMTTTIDDPCHRYPAHQFESITPQVSAWAAQFPGKKVLDYTFLTFKVVEDGHHRGVPQFILGAMKAFAIEKRRRYGYMENQAYLEVYYPQIIAELSVKPQYLEPGTGLP